MSNPISNVTSIPSAAKTSSISEASENAPELEIDGPIDPTSPPPLLEVDAAEASETASSPTSSPTSPHSASSSDTDASPKKGRGGMGLLALLLGLLLAGSVAFNLKQSRDITTLSDTNGQFEMALTAAVDRIDLETVRAESAETKLGGIGGAVETVNERVASLLEALTALSAVAAE